MKNLVECEIEKLEALPKRGKTRLSEPSYDNDYPWNRVERFLVSRINQNWDDICAEFIWLTWIPVRHRRTSKLQDHVESNTFIKGGRVYYFPKFGNGLRLWHEFEVPIQDTWRDILYVHPVSRILRIEKAVRPTYEKKNKDMFVLGEMHQLAKLGGVWFEIKAKPSTFYSPKWPIDYKREPLVRSLYVQITLKRQLTSKELKSRGLKNDNAVVREFARLKKLTVKKPALGFYAR